jgi:hypothetical protein
MGVMPSTGSVVIVDFAILPLLRSGMGQTDCIMVKPDIKRRYVNGQCRRGTSQGCGGSAIAATRVGIRWA